MTKHAPPVEAPPDSTWSECWTRLETCSSAAAATPEPPASPPNPLSSARSWARLNQAAQEQLDAGEAGAWAALDGRMDINAQVPLPAVTRQTVNWIERLAPFGEGNPSPTFLSNAVGVRQAKTVGADNGHLRLDLRRLVRNRLAPGPSRPRNRIASRHRLATQTRPPGRSRARDHRPGGVAAILVHRTPSDAPHLPVTGSYGGRGAPIRGSFYPLT